MSNGFPTITTGLLLAGWAVTLAAAAFLGCTDRLSPPKTDDAMTAPITDTAAVYQVHGLRFAVPDGLVPITDRYVFTDVPMGGNRDHDPHNEITVFVDATRSPQDIISDVMDGLDTASDGPHLHNQRRTRVNGRMIRQATITYVPRNQRYPDESGDTVRIDYAFIPDEASGETWGFRLIPPDTSLKPDVLRDWVTMLENIEAQPNAEVPFIGNRRENGTRYFHTRRHRIVLPERWKMINDISFSPTQTPGKSREVEKVKRCVIFLRSSALPNDPEEQTVDDLAQSFSRYGLSGIVEERTVSGRSILWVEIEPRTEQGRVRIASQRASIKTNKSKTHYDHVQLEMDVEYVISDADAPPTSPKFVVQMKKMHEAIFQSIEFSD